MAERFQIDAAHQWKSIKIGLPFLPLLFAGVVIFIFFIRIRIDDYSIALTIFGLYYLLLFSPAIYLHLTYINENWNTVLTINSSFIEIQNGKGEFKFKHEDIAKTELNLEVYYKNRIDNGGRWERAWTGYGYLKLKLKDGKKFYLTSLMLDLNDLPFSVTTTRFRLVPYIDKEQIEYSEIRRNLNQRQQEKIAKYQAKFKNLPDEILLDKINNPTKFELEARKAAESILEERNASPTNSLEK